MDPHIAMEAINDERERQVMCGYGMSHDARHSPTEWVAIITHELGAVADCALNPRPDTDWLKCALIKTASVSVAALEALCKED